MTRKTSIVEAMFLPLLFALIILGPGKAACGGLFLVDGVGFEGKLEIGMPAPTQARALGDQPGWYGLDSLPIYFKMTAGRHIAVIRCDKYCLTNRSISIGSSVQDVRTYGKPWMKSRSKGKDFSNIGASGLS
jgi:hypothetical protein